jgi:hypothetical protein
MDPNGQVCEELSKLCSFVPVTRGENEFPVHWG